MNIFFLLILLFVVAGFGTGQMLNFLNYRNFRESISDDVKKIYNETEYRNSRQYFIARQKLGLISEYIGFALLVIALCFGLLGRLSDWIQDYTQEPFWHAVLFFGIIIVANELLSIPFDWVRTFKIEERFGFNRSTPKLFIIDKIKGYLVSCVIGGGLLYLFILIYTSMQADFWWMMWIAVTVFLLLLTMFYASLFLPLFNKLEPLQAGTLRTAIEDYCAKTGFRLNNIFVMDGSKRSTHANAFFSGLGPRKKIVLFDTLIQKHSEEELVAVLAHETGHYKLKHTFKSLLISILHTGLLLFLLAQFLSSDELAMALGASSPAFHLNLLGFVILYSPLSMFVSTVGNYLSRKHEFEADNYAMKTFNGKHLSSALKKLSVDSLSNPEPHPAYVFMHYSHPPLLQRLKKLE